MGVWAIKRQLGANGRNRICSRDGVNDTDLHCVADCTKTAGVRKETGVSQFFTLAKLLGIGTQKAYALFVHGQDLSGNLLSDEEYQERGRCWQLSSRRQKDSPFRKAENGLVIFGFNGLLFGLVEIIGVKSMILTGHAYISDITIGVIRYC